MKHPRVVIEPPLWKDCYLPMYLSERYRELFFYVTIVMCVRVYRPLFLSSLIKILTVRWGFEVLEVERGAGGRTRWRVVWGGAGVWFS